MSLKKKIEQKLNEALKAKDKNTYPTLRLVVSAIKDAEIAGRTKGQKEMSDSDINTILKKMIKQRNESVEIYKKNNREDLLKIEQGEINLLSTYLPKQLSEEETKKVCSEIITKVGAQNIKDMGKVMGELKKSYSDSMDFSKAGSMLKELLNKQWNIQKSILKK